MPGRTPRKSRAHVPNGTAAYVLTANKHTCCICHEPRKHVQLHHIDGDPSNNVPENLAVLCLDCHSRVTGDEGLGRRFTPDEVREYKRRWEARCAESEDDLDRGEEEVEEPISLLYEVTALDPDTHIGYDFELDEGQELLLSLRAESYIDVSVCGLSDYQRWIEGRDLMEYEGAERVRRCDLSFEAPRAGTYLVLLINKSRGEIEVEVDMATWGNDEDR